MLAAGPNCVIPGGASACGNAMTHTGYRVRLIMRDHLLVLTSAIMSIHMRIHGATHRMRIGEVTVRMKAAAFTTRWSFTMRLLVLPAERPVTKPEQPAQR